MTTATKAKSIVGETLMQQMQLTHGIAKANLGDVTHQDSVKCPDPAGNCLNWILGHMVKARNGALQVLGNQPVMDDAQLEPYNRHGEPLTDPSKAVRFEDLMAAFDKAQEPIIDGLSRITEEQLAHKAPFSPTNNPNETVGSLLIGLTFHEAYHVGQTGLGRRVVGKPALDL